MSVITFNCLYEYTSKYVRCLTLGRNDFDTSVSCLVMQIDEGPMVLRSNLIVMYINVIRNIFCIWITVAIVDQVQCSCKLNDLLSIALILNYLNSIFA